MEHPYKDYENTQSWNLIKEILIELKENQDIIFNTREEYIIGYFCKQLNKRTEIIKERIRNTNN